ncbi:MAG TPA: hypothetical protein DCX03_05470 [Bacteroidales bacterium]|nr:hypothetical protein [Bacteroidales bacterium]
MKIIWPNENGLEDKIISLNGKKHHEDSSNHCINNQDNCLYDNELKDLLNSVKDNNYEKGIEKGIEIGTRESFDKMLGSISSSELVEERYRFDNSKETSQKALSALVIYTKCIDNGCYPPEEILRFIADKFNDFICSDNNLDTVFGVNKNSRKTYMKRIKYIDLVLEIDFIRHNLCINIDDAIESILELYKDKGIHYAFETLEDIYYRDGKKELDNSSMEQHRRIFTTDVFDTDYEKIKHLEQVLAKYPKRTILKLKDKYAHIKPLLSSLIENQSRSCK